MDVEWAFDHWVIMALAAAAAWAISSVLDVCFVSNGIYKRAVDGTMVSGLFCLLPAAATIGYVQFENIDLGILCMGMLSGAAYLLHVYFYFKALFELNDAVNAEVFNSLNVVVVPVLAFIVLAERLSWSHYLAIGITAVAIVLLIGAQLSRLSSRSVVFLVASVTSISVMMVSQAWILERVDYATGIWLYSSTAFVLTLAAVALVAENRHRVGQMFRRFAPIFIVVEMLEIAAVLSSQRATATGPSVSLVALIECALPIFIMLFSFMAAYGSKILLPTQYHSVRNALSLQTVAAPAKVLSMILIACAIFVVQG